MFNPQRWQQQIAGADCAICRELAVRNDVEPRFVATLPSGRIVLQNDAAFRGYCILQFHRHATELTDLHDAERGQLMMDVARLAAALQRIVHPAKLNYAILGNEVPHLHVHVIPRFPEDGYWGRAIWLRPASERRDLAEREYADLRRAIAAAL